jgi:hypothetical protein
MPRRWLRIRVPLLAPTVEKPYHHVALPTKIILATDYANGRALVEVPMDDLPDHPGLRAALAAVQDNAAPDQAPIGAILRNLWRDHLADRYRERAGEYQPERK